MLGLAPISAGAVSDGIGVVAPPVTPVITTDPFKSYAGAILGSTVIPHVLVIEPSSAGVILTLADQTTESDGSLLIEDASLSIGVTYLVVSFNDTGSDRGAKAYAAA